MESYRGTRNTHAQLSPVPASIPSISVLSTISIFNFAPHRSVGGASDETYVKPMAL